MKLLLISILACASFLSAISQSNNAKDNYRHDYEKIGRIENPFARRADPEKTLGITFSGSKGFSCSGIDWRGVFNSYFSSGQLKQQTKYALNILMEGAASESLHFLLQTYPSLAHVIEFYLAQGRATLSLDLNRCEILDKALRTSVRDALIAECVNDKVAQGMSMDEAVDRCKNSGTNAQDWVNINLRLSDAIKKVFPHALGNDKTAQSQLKSIFDPAKTVKVIDGKTVLQPPVEELASEYKKAFDSRIKTRGGLTGVPPVDELSISFFEVLSLMPDETQKYYSEHTARLISLCTLQQAYKEIDIQYRVNGVPADVAVANTARSLHELISAEMQSLSASLQTRQTLSESERAMTQYLATLFNARVREARRIRAEKEIMNKQGIGLPAEKCCKR